MRARLRPVLSTRHNLSERKAQAHLQEFLQSNTKRVKGRAWCCPKDALICGLEGLAATDCCDASIGEHCCGDICCARNQECQFDGVEFGCSTTEDEAGEAESASSTNDGKAMMLATVGSYGFSMLAVGASVALWSM
ncbi:hypothetical protein CC1G_14265 [Coprinopsis cinerea okayama7|uniref:Uncharacterized protein n=1 Tax=Coprinopsis cinerea (strain Okayama-7 / 130 / ATCC MYA-4618 / FGSC 9003) TaxID=240176 RepID=D6RLF6_COPC7|nr:hypothetical protein CC1G_14265 [Coprinopsis cinerea okayama7\|eukprot:XP_002911734.1 hypothetical protein CC1G_14265 [Coprinopsis cinerea okayama7\